MLKQLVKNLNNNKKSKKVLTIGINKHLIDICILYDNVFIEVDSYRVIEVDKKEKGIFSLVKDLIQKFLENNNGCITVQVYCKKGQNILEGIEKNIKGVKIVKKHKSFPVINTTFYSPDEMVGILKDFFYSIDDTVKILSLCREDLSQLSLNKSMNCMWGSKEVGAQIKNILSQVISNKEDEWDRIQFYNNMVCRSIKSTLYYLNNDINKNMISSVTVPNIRHNFEKIKRIVVKVSLIILEFLKLDEIIKKYTNYPTTFFIRSDLFEDLKDDYNNLINFIIKIPIYDKVLFQLELSKYNN